MSTMTTIADITPTQGRGLPDQHIYGICDIGFEGDIAARVQFMVRRLRSSSCRKSAAGCLEYKKGGRLMPSANSLQSISLLHEGVDAIAICATKISHVAHGTCRIKNRREET